MNKHVKIMADHCATAFWHETGCNEAWDFVPVSDPLLANLKAWSRYYDLNADDGGDKPPFDHVHHTQWGESIAKLVKDECPHWTVMYFNETKCHDEKCPPEEYCYEIK